VLLVISAIFQKQVIEMVCELFFPEQVIEVVSEQNDTNPQVYGFIEQ